jgi:large conductance mechanosensitive channel
LQSSAPSNSTDEAILEELREIKKLLTVTPPPPPAKGTWNEFKSFLEQYKVLGLAVAFILGLYLGNLVKALVADLILPIIPLPKGQAIDTYMAGPFGVGDFAVNLLTFIIVAFVIFLMVKGANHLNIS